MFNPEKNFNNVKKNLPQSGQRVIAYNNKLNELIDSVFIDGKFLENDHELINITRWIEYKNNIIH